MLKCTVRRSCQLSKDLQTLCGLQIIIIQDLYSANRLAQQCLKSFMEWVSMAEQLHPSLTPPSAMQSVRCS
ncbi:unnamed protein product, partial [Staurois parvus]